MSTQAIQCMVYSAKFIKDQIGTDTPAMQIFEYLSERFDEEYTIK